MPGFDDDLRLAHVLADAIEPTALDLFGSLGSGTTIGPDGLLTTDAGIRLEELLRHQLQRTRPRDLVEGRLGETTGQGERRWVLDALDGAANYVRGVPVWGTLISLVVEDRAVLGLVAAPSLSRRWWAGRGTGAWTGRTLSRARPVAVSRTAVLPHASMSVDEVTSWRTGPHGPGFDELAQGVWRTRAFGDFWSHALVAEGAVDLALGASLDPLQLAALTPLVEEAGGQVTDALGDPVDVASGATARAVVTSNGLLHHEALHLLSGEPARLG